jgi:hypothetical protein
MIQPTPGYAYKPLYEEDMETVTAQICELFGMTVSQLRGKSRKREIIIARHFAMYFCEENSLGSLKSIGKFFGGRDHSTVIHALRSVEDQAITNPRFKQTVEDIRNELNEKKDLRFKFFPEAGKSTEQVNENLDVLQELKNQI